MSKLNIFSIWKNIGICRMLTKKKKRLNASWKMVEEMKNKEKFAKEIVEIACSGNKLALYDGEIRACKSLPCSECDFYNGGVLCDSKCKAWAESEYVKLKHEIDWASVPVDTPVIIKGFNFNRRYFSRILPDGRISTFSHGRTSWSAQGMALEVSYSKSDVVLAREEDKLKYRKRVE